MDDRPGTAQRERVAAESAGYPLRDEATESFAPPPLEPVEEEIYAAPAEPGARVARRRRFVPASPWPAVLAVLLLLAGLLVAYAVTRPSNSTGPGGPAPAAAPPAQPPPAQQQPAQPAPSPPKTTAGHRPAPSPPKTTAPAQPPPAAPAQQLMSVPNLVGRQGLAAVHALQSDHLVASLRYVPSTQPARRVVSQFPAGGQRVRRGTTVRLNLSQGLRPAVSVPNVVGESEASASSQLAAAGFTVRSVARSTSDPADDGKVVGEQPHGGSRASRGSTVTVYVARSSGG